MSLTTAQYGEKVADLVAENEAGRKNIDAKNVRPVSKRTMGRFEKKNEILTGNAEPTTNARAVGCSDTLNLASFVAVCKAVLSQIRDELLFNTDGSSLSSGGTAKRNIKVKFTKESKKANKSQLKCLPVKGENAAVLVEFFLKFDITCASNGAMGPPVFLIADENMPKGGEPDLYLVTGLGAQFGPEHEGFMAFDNSRRSTTER